MVDAPETFLYSTFQVELTTAVVTSSRNVVESPSYRRTEAALRSLGFQKNGGLLLWVVHTFG